MRKLHALLLAILMTLVFGTMYVLVQQYGRSVANDQPKALAESVAAEMKDRSNQTSLPFGKLDITTSLQTFIVIYGKNYKPLAGTGYINGALPVIDKGVLQHASPSHDNEVTWQPKSGVRVAAVVVRAGDYYVLGGQSLQPTEARTDGLAKLTALGWGAAMVCIATTYFVMRRR